MNKNFHALIIMDGFAFAENKAVSAIDRAGTPNIDKLYSNYPFSKIDASGMAVGLPKGQMGNSEVGHLNIGAGRVVYQELTRVTKAIMDGDFFTNPEFIDAVNYVKSTGGQIHFAGLLSDGGVHSHNTHLNALLKLAKDAGLPEAYVHCFLDGRDVSPTSGAGFVKELYEYTQQIGFGKIATVCGRYYAMDRDNRWDRVQKAYDMMTKGAETLSDCPYSTIKASYESGVTDEFIQPTSVNHNGKAVTVENGDAVIFFNFRPDRAREITRVFTEDIFDGFERKEKLDIKYVCFTQYDATFKNVSVAFKPQDLVNTLGEILAKNNLSQLRIAETEKYAHVTFFFNGGVETPNDNEDRILVQSPKVATYDLQPEMGANEVTEKAIEAIKSGKYDVMILNYANCDMVGHTGNMEAAIKAVKTVDECVGRLVNEILAIGGTALITADHGNADKMLDEEGGVFTAHTTNPVPLMLVGEKYKDTKLESGKLADIAPTLLTIMGLEVPADMTGTSLVK